jgi:hypothetical protein
MSTIVTDLPEILAEAPEAVKREILPEDLLAMPDGGHYELVDGALKERNVGVLSSIVAANAIATLTVHCDQTGAGTVLASDCGYKCFPWKPGHVRKADVSFIRADRLTAEIVSEGFCPIAPDLAVEVVSPGDLVWELDEKVQEYLRAGVKLVWVLHPAIRAAQIFRHDHTATWLWEGADLSGEDVLPGFLCRVGSLFPNVGQAEPQNSTEPEAMSTESRS